MALFALPHLRFVKASGCGNDFLIVNRADVPASADLGGLTRKLCERTNGIGADGVEWLSSEEGCDVAARLINSDGSEAEISGNGTRCVAAWWLAQNSGSEVRVKTGAGVKRCTLNSRSDRRF